MGIPENPVRALRAASGLDRAAFACLLGRSYERIAAFELDYPPAVPEAWREPIKAAGFDFDALRDAYAARKAALTAEALATKQAAHVG